ncbi:MAG: rhomboid family intramembrane serine protease [Alphaproteobacteria bacterium]|jgi:membrane associated rhomboid family serine protease|tara:strand:+ start:41 stop:631 length:591 start_codon:yes stop_codon:yes gene_type:complete
MKQRWIEQMEAIKKKFAPVILFVTAIWIVEIANFFLGHGLTAWGIWPRQASGLSGIPLAPFLHGGLWHAASNTLPLLILGSLMIVGGRARFWAMTTGIVLLGGFLVWLFARNALHVGASGLVFGYFGALLSRAYFERNLLSIVIACATVLLYGGILWGILPLRSHISFEGHLFGLVAGVVMAWLSHHYQPAHPKGE